MGAPTDFSFSQHTEPHRTRTRDILQSHPDIKHLIGKSQSTFWITLTAVVFQLAMAYVLRNQAWWVVLLSAYFIGAFAAHTLFVCIHEAAHNLIFKKPAGNLLTAILANVPTILPTAIYFRYFHIKHHAFQGVHELDTDLPGKMEAKMIGSFFIGKAVWLFFFPIFQTFRTFRFKEAKAFNRWVLLNMVVQVAVTAAVIYAMGWMGLLYLVGSLWFSVGLHPLGARWIQEHYLVLDKNQETYSYYGRMNTLNLNVGYHNEHHDFPSIPWNRLPELKAKAPEFYDTLLYHTSFVKLFFRFLFDQEISLFSRITRQDRGKVPFNDVSKPDEELIQANEVKQKVNVLQEEIA